MKSEIEGFIADYVSSYKSVTKWDAPLVAFADANDPLFKKLKEVVDPDHALPSDLLEDAQTVVSYFIPFRRKIGLSNAKSSQASKEWVLAYMETNQLMIDLNHALSEMLKKLGYDSAVTPPTHNFDEKKLVSLWSHKHIAYIAGLGNFGVHNMLITEKGCCGRLGSMITNAKIESTNREGKEFCLHKTGKPCGMCVKKCSFGALKLNGLDKHKCYEACLENARTYSKIGLADVCGKCVADVPCSFCNPSRNSDDHQ